MNPLVFLLALASFVVGTVELIIGGTLPLIAEDLQVSISAAGQLITVFSLSFAFASPILLHLTARVERKRLYLSCLVLFFLSNLLAALSPSYAVLLIARILSAISSALLVVLSITIASTIVEPAYRGRAIGIIFMGISGSLVLGVPLGMTLGNAFGWRSPFWLICGLSVVALIALALFLPSLRTPPPIPLTEQIRSLKNSKMMSGQLLSLFMLTGHLTLYAYFMPFLQSVVGLPVSWISGVYFLFGIAAVLGGGIGGWLSDKWGAARSMVVIISLFALVMTLIPFAVKPLPLFLLVMMLWSGLSWSISPAQQQYLIQSAPDNADVHLGLNMSALHLGIALGSAIGGVVVEQASIVYNPWVGAAFVLVSLACAVFSITRPAGVRRSSVQTEEMVSAQPHV